MVKFDIYFIIYTIDILDKVVKNLYIFINKIFYLGFSFDTQSSQFSSFIQLLLPTLLHNTHIGVFYKKGPNIFYSNLANLNHIHPYMYQILSADYMPIIYISDSWAMSFNIKKIYIILRSISFMLFQCTMQRVCILPKKARYFKIPYIVLMSHLALNSIYDIIKHVVNNLLKEICRIIA